MNLSTIGTLVLVSSLAEEPTDLNQQPSDLERLADIAADSHAAIVEELAKRSCTGAVWVQYHAVSAKSPSTADGSLMPLQLFRLGLKVYEKATPEGASSGQEQHSLMVGNPLGGLRSFGTDPQNTLLRYAPQDVSVLPCLQGTLEELAKDLRLDVSPLSPEQRGWLAQASLASITWNLNHEDMQVHCSATIQLGREEARYDTLALTPLELDCSVRRSDATRKAAAERFLKEKVVPSIEARCDNPSNNSLYKDGESDTWLVDGEKPFHKCMDKVQDATAGDYLGYECYSTFVWRSDKDTSAGHLTATCN